MNYDLLPVWMAIRNCGGTCYYYGETLRRYMLKLPTPTFEIKAINTTLQELTYILKDMEFQYIDGNNHVTIVHADTQYCVHIMHDLRELAEQLDFSINCIYSDCLTGNVWDPQGGILDLKLKTLKISKEALLNDPIKLVRAARLCAELGFAPSVETWFDLYENARVIKHADPLLLQTEITGIMALPNPSTAFKLLQSTRVLEHVLPELAACETIIQNKRAGVHNVFEHTMYAIDAATQDIAIRLTMLFHDIAKPQTIEYSDDGKIHFFRHDLVGAKVAKQYLKAWGYDKDLINKVTVLVTNHMFDAAPNITDKAVRRLIKKVGKEYIYDLLLVREADRAGSPEKISMKKVKAIRKKIDKEIQNV